MPPFGSDDNFDDGEEDTLRAELERNFGRAESGELTADNAASLPIDPPKDPASSQDSKRGSGDAQADGPSHSASPASADPQPASDGRARNPDGTFATKAPETAGQQPATGTQPQPDGKPQSQPDAAAAAAQPWAPAPATLSDAGKQAWNGLHPEIRQHLARTENEHRQQLNTFAEPLLPVREAAERHGLDWKEGLGKLVAAQNYLDRDPAGALIWLAQAHGIDLDVVAERAATAMPQPNGGAHAANPINQLNTIIQPLNNRLTQIEQARQQDEQSRRQAATDATLREVNTFAADPANKHFDKVQGEIGALMPYIRQQNPSASPTQLLKIAYDQAVYANAGVRAQVEAERRQADDAQRRDQSRQKTVTSKALQMLTSHTGGGRSVPANGNAELSLHDELSANWDAWAAQN